MTDICLSSRIIRFVLYLQVSKSTRFFKVHLQYLENETITLKNGQQLVIPKQLYEICSFIFNRVETEGVFRKEGSRSRQQEIKVSNIFFVNIFIYMNIILFSSLFIL